MPRFEMHLLSGAILAFFMQRYPPLAFSFLLGSVFPDIDNKKSITHRTAILFLGVMAITVLYPQGFFIAVGGALLLSILFYAFLPRHRGWMHKTAGHLFFATLCFMFTQNPLAFLGGFLGTLEHRLLDGA